MTALTFEPKPTSPAREISMHIGAAIRSVIAEARGEYRLTALGTRVVYGPIEVAYAQMAILQPMSSGDLERLVSYLHRLVESSLDAPEPPSKWCLAYSRRTDPGDDRSAVAHIDQYLGDFGAYRDDAHLAVWQWPRVDGLGCFFACLAR